ncbi:MAG TPA: MBL fold metallo-hydrolase [Opitutaceae bacterium]|nr:MBL fold metallo-hydrolase [Opitutaceae bacterium]
MSFPLSDHCNGKTFFNPGVSAERGLGDLLRWQFQRGSRVPWPRWVETVPAKPPARAPGNTVTVTWINHATFLLQTPRGNFLTDPVFSERTSPVSWIGPRRVHAPGIDFDALPAIDGVLLSHDHYDHCDVPTLRRLAASHRPRVIAPLGHRSLLESAGLSQVAELDWWQQHAWAEDFSVTLTPARHWCRRRPGQTNHRLWGGFFLHGLETKVHFAGDSAYDPALFRSIRERLGAPDLAMIPIGAYEPRWFMRTAHMNPAESVQVHRDLGARLSVAMHWGCWHLTDEGRDDPPRALEIARSTAGMSANEFRVLAPGESVAAPRNVPSVD